MTVIRCLEGVLLGFVLEPEERQVVLAHVQVRVQTVTSSPSAGSAASEPVVMASR